MMFVAAAHMETFKKTESSLSKLLMQCIIV